MALLVVLAVAVLPAAADTSPLLGHGGFFRTVSRSIDGDLCPGPEEVYSFCAMVRDVRSLLSFSLGAAACGLVAHWYADGEDAEVNDSANQDSQADCYRSWQLLTSLG